MVVLWCMIIRGGDGSGGGGGSGDKPGDTLV